MEKPHIAIIGGGNIGTLTAAQAARYGYPVTLLVRNIANHRDRLTLINTERGEQCPVCFSLTDNYAEALSQADLVLVTVPGTAVPGVIDRLKANLTRSIPVGSTFASAGNFVALAQDLNQWFGMERVPYVARRRGDDAVEMLSHKSLHNIYFSPACPAEQLTKILEEIFEGPVHRIEHKEQVMVSNSNPLLHPARISTLSPVLDRPPRFYVDWPIEASERLIKMDNELRQLFIKRGIPPIESITEHYGVTDAEQLTRKISSIPSFQNIVPPYRQRPDGRWEFDFNSRYFAEDFELGLRPTISLLESEGIDCPMMKQIYQYYLDLKCPKA